MIRPQAHRMLKAIKWYKCHKCGAKLFYGELADLEIKCRKCGHINRFSDNSVQFKNK